MYESLCGPGHLRFVQHTGTQGSNPRLSNTILNFLCTTIPSLIPTADIEAGIELHFYSTLAFCLCTFIALVTKFSKFHFLDLLNVSNFIEHNESGPSSGPSLN